MKIERAPLPDGANLVPTVPFTMAQRMLVEIMDERGCLEVTGEGGLGKTFCADSFFAEHDSDVVKIHLEGKVHGYGFLRRLVIGLGGVAGPEDSGQTLMTALRAAVGSRRVYVYVDEANLLNVESLRQIRYLRDQRDIHIAFVLVGTDFRQAYRGVPELWSRVTRRIAFDRLEGATLLAALAAYHPFLATADKDLLLRIDSEHCRGNWRVWSSVLPVLIDRANRIGSPVLTVEVASAVLGVMVDRRRAKVRGSAARRPANVA